MVTAWEGTQLTGAAPLMRRRGALSSLTNWHSPGYGFLGRDELTNRGLAAEIFSSMGPRHVTLAFIDREDSTWRPSLEAADAQGRLLHIRTVQRSPSLRVSGNWEDFERDRLSRNRRQNFRRARRKLEGQGELSYQVQDGSADLDRGLADGFEVEAAGWKGARGSAIRSNQRTQRFYTDVARWAADQGLLRLSFLRLDRRVVAFDYGLEHDGVYYLLKTGFDPRYSDFSPGNLLRYESVRQSFRDGLRRYEFLGGPEPYKLIWTDELREMGRIQAFSGSPIGRLEHLAWRRIPPIVRRARAVRG